MPQNAIGGVNSQSVLWRLVVIVVVIIMYVVLLCYYYYYYYTIMPNLLHDCCP